MIKLDHKSKKWGVTELVLKIRRITALHTAAEPAVHEAVKN